MTNEKRPMTQAEGQMRMTEQRMEKLIIKYKD